MFASHSWPRWGNARIREVAQRDAYANLNNQALNYASGVSINEVHNVYEVPKSLRDQWAARSYHGDVQNNVRAVTNRFLGHYNGNPVNLIPLPPKDFGGALCGDDGRRNEDRQQGRGSSGARQVPARDRDPEQAGFR
jgi:alkyl sulfatase BDS1-like metallo-beta-lactamase superfamily hydrolase